MKIYILNHLGKKRYIFVPVIKNTELLIDKLKNSTITNTELEQLDKVYNYSLSKIDNIKDCVIYKYSVDKYSIIDLKKLIFV